MNADQSMSAMGSHVPRLRSRREFLLKAGGGFGALALSCLLDHDGLLRAAEAAKQIANPLAPKEPPLKAKAKAVIFLFMEGGPSHLDTFDPKPELTRLHGQKLPSSFGTVITPMGTGSNTLLASKRTFKKFGKSGIEVSDWLPHIGSCVDDLAVIRSCWA